jgi:hypothetical protein
MDDRDCLAHYVRRGQDRLHVCPRKRSYRLARRRAKSEAMLVFPSAAGLVTLELSCLAMVPKFTPDPQDRPTIGTGEVCACLRDKTASTTLMANTTSSFQSKSLAATARGILSDLTAHAGRGACDRNKDASREYDGASN